MGLRKILTEPFFDIFLVITGIRGVGLAPVSILLDRKIHNFIKMRIKPLYIGGHRLIRFVISLSVVLPNRDFDFEAPEISYNFFNLSQRIHCELGRASTTMWYIDFDAE